MSGVVVPASAGVSLDVRARMRALAERRFRESTHLPTRFFEAHADAISRACLALAERFQAGGRLLVFGEGAAATDAQHVAVEFVHPVLVGKRALPAISLGSDLAALTGAAAARPPGEAFAHLLSVIGRQTDIAMGIAGPRPAEAVSAALLQAHRMGMLTLFLAGGGVSRFVDLAVGHVFIVPSDDAMLVQEVHETLYHILWELVHVFLDAQMAR
jgi:D-sedoheptulose 7-phosphate isomerase